MVTGLLALCVVFPNRAQEVSTDRSTYLPKEPIKARFSGGPGFVADWLGLYKESAPNGDLLTWYYLDGSQNGQAPLVAGERVFPDGLPEPGVYELRFFENDSYNLVSDPVLFTVTNTARIFLSSSSLVPGTPVGVTFTNAPGNAKDWIGLFAAGAADTSPLVRRYLDGTDTGSTPRTSGILDFTNALPAGSYEARLFANDTTQLLDRVLFGMAYPKPVVAADPGEQSVVLTWPAVPWPVAVEKYVVLTGAGNSSDFAPIAEVPAQSGEHQYQHLGQVNGQERCYVVRALGAGAVAVAESEPVCTAPYSIPSADVIAYGVPAGTRGTQAWPGALGMEFQVVNPISIEALGVFDSGSDGLRRPLTVRIYNLTNKTAVASLEFTPAAPGALQAGSRFKPLQPPLRLEIGFRGMIVAEGYGAEEPAGNAYFQPIHWETSDGDGSLVFTGTSSFGPAGEMPVRADKGPANRYAAGTFQFRVLEVVAPGKPVLTVVPNEAAAELSWPAVDRPVPAAKYRVFRAYEAAGTFSQIAESTDPQYRDAGLTNGAPVCYKVQAFSAAGVPGPESDVVCRVPDQVKSGRAYVHPADSVGNQEFGGSVGNDFDVVRPIRVLRLGAFDDGSDGLKRSIKVRLYDRTNQSELAMLAFTEADPGELVGGSRFKNLAQPVSLPIGFQGTIVASGYGPDERVANQGIGGTEFNFETFTGGSLEFVGSARFGENPDAFPGIPDTGPTDRYGAGTFFFEPVQAVDRPRLQLVWSNRTLQLQWLGTAQLESAAKITGPWAAVPNASSGLTIPLTAAAQFYRLVTP